MSIHYSKVAGNRRTSPAPSSQQGKSVSSRIAVEQESKGAGGGLPRQARQRPKSAFAHAQKERLLQLRAALKESMHMAASDACPDSGSASAIATHPGDAGTDASDRDLALRLLYLEQNTLHEIDEALQRIDQGTYGICEVSGERIPMQRLEAIPFARFTVECQAHLEKKTSHRPVPAYGSALDIGQ